MDVWSEITQWASVVYGKVILSEILEKFIVLISNPFFLRITQNVAAAAKSLQSYPTLRDPTDGSPPGSPVPGIL